MELKKALQTALEFEQKGHKVYEEAANNTSNDIVEKTFRYLANQELIHIEEVKEYIQTINNGHKIELKGDTLNQTQNFFTMTIKKFKQKTELSQDDINAHETALELEQSAYDFYKQQHDKTNDEDAKKFFRWLMVQENAHYTFIQKTYEFIKNPIAFYTAEERWMADGG